MKDDKLNLLILFGGVSSEHEVSRVSAASVLRHIDGEKYNITKVGITREGRWFATEASPEEIGEGSWEKHPGNAPAVILPDHSRTLIRGEGDRSTVDVVFPVLHGKNGEDGTMQGLLEIAGIPYVGSDSFASAACMDKAVTKAVVDQAQVCRQALCSVVHRGCDCTEAAGVIDDFFDGTYPLFVKPAAAGSSVGISKVTSADGLSEALETAFREDDKALVEEFIDGREIEVAVLGNRDPVASCIGEIFTAGEFYDYSAKYENAESRTDIVRNLPPEKEAEIRATAVAIYEIMGCRGLARVDFFLMRDGTLVFNEINTIPGFTNISMYPQLWQESGIGYGELIDKLIELAQER